MDQPPEIRNVEPSSGGSRALVARLAPLRPLAVRVLRFASVGFVGFVTDSLLFTILYRQGVPIADARAVSIVAATFVTWSLNRIFTFGPSNRSPLHEMGRYGVVALVAQGTNYGLFLALMATTRAAAPLVCIVASSGVAALLSFAGQSLFAFAPVRVRPAAAAQAVSSLDAV
jgi:putative flippase GtrA